jgi:hypothetical protein
MTRKTTQRIQATMTRARVRCVAKSPPWTWPHRYYSVEADLPGRPLFVIYNVHLICEPD